MDEINIIVNSLIEDSDDELFNSSTTTSSDSDEELLLMLSNREDRKRTNHFVNEVVTTYSDEEFKKHFRMSKETANFCIELVNDAKILSDNASGRKKISPTKAFFMTVWYLANEETYRQISDRFDSSESSCYNIIEKIIDFLVQISGQYIKWPTVEQQIVIADEFKKKQGLEGVIGCIDGTHILFNRPGEEQMAYCNRKGTYSIIIQGVVDHALKFIDIFCGEPGSQHDIRILKKSTLYEKGEKKQLNLEDRYILGGSAYPSLSWLVPPFKDNERLTHAEKQFNFKHSSTSSVNDNAFSLLKGRFRRLRKFDNIKISFIVKCVVAACTLHNICLIKDNFNDDIANYVDDI